jgi:hypothetical protein
MTQVGSAPEMSWSPIVELRQYTLHPGKRDVLIDLFDREFIESQEALGMRVIGQFRDLDHSDRFVWVRGFRDMTTRAQGLQAFYGGPVWKQHRDAANATMIDSDDVLLLRPARSRSGFSPAGSQRPPRGSRGARSGLVVASIHSLDAASQAAFIDYVEDELRPALTDVGAALLAYFVTESSANNFPALPVREGEHVFTWFAGFPDSRTYEGTIPGRGELGISITAAPAMQRPMQVLRLLPTPRSALTGSSRACPARTP